MKRLLSRALALVFALTLTLGALPAASALNGDAARAADILNTLGLIEGNGGDYALTAPATRAQATVALVRLAGAEQTANASKATSTFADLPAWAAPSIRYAAAQGWVKGYHATSFRPNQAVGANGWYAMLLRLLGYSDTAGEFRPDEAALVAQRLGLGDGETSPFSRGDLFSSLLSALHFPKKAGGTLLEDLLAKGLVSSSTVNAVGLGADTALSARQIADRFSAAVFSLDCYDSQLHLDAEAPAASASGFFIDSAGIAVTNYHSIEDIPLATATLSTGERFLVEKVLYYDKDIDVAVIRLSNTSLAGKRVSAFACLEMVSVETARPGDTVYALGNPLGLGLSVSSGIVSALNRSAEGYALPLLQSTAAISQGSSGGALLNAYGQVLGVTSGAYVYGNSMYLAVPIDAVLEADLSGEGWTLRQVKERER